MTELKVTSAGQWRQMREEGIVLQLPSGFCARLRPLSLEVLWKSGRLPSQLQAITAELIKTGGTYNPDPATLVHDAVMFIELQEVMLKEIFLEPQIVDEVNDPDTEILFEHVTGEDRNWAIWWAQSPQRAVANFREEQEATLEPASNG